MSGAPVDLLVPRPQRAVATGSAWTLPAEPALRITADDPRLGALGARLAAAPGAERPLRWSAPTAGPADLELALDPRAGDRPGAYRLEIGAAGVRRRGADPAGLFHGAATLAQWLRLALRDGDGGRRLPGLEISDWPDHPARGVMLDVSRNKVPSMDTLRRLVDRLADWKINQLQLYTEHTFAYRGHETVWREASPLTPDEVRELDAWCRNRFVELVPNQNSFGHMHRWLRHEPYRRLAEVPEGLEHPFSDEREPFSLCPGDPGSLALLADLYDQLLPLFGSRLFNVGLDETLDLGRGRSAAACAERGTGAVYVDFLRDVHRLVRERGHRMQFWADIVLREPDLVGRLPGDVIPLVWGYEADHPFGEEAERVAAAGLEFYLCPGTSSWNSLAGRLPNALANLAAAADAGRRSGAAGLLVTDWGDFGHLQPLPVSYPGLLAGAALAWNGSASFDPDGADLGPLLDHHLFEGPEPSLGEALVELGRAYLGTGALPRNGSALFFLWLGADRALAPSRFEGLDGERLGATLARLEAVEDRLAAARAATREAALAARELLWVARMLAVACRLGRARLAAGRETPVGALPAPVRRELAREIGPLSEELRHVWLARNRPGGLDDSAARLTRVRDLLAGS